MTHLILGAFLVAIVTDVTWAVQCVPTNRNKNCDYRYVPKTGSCYKLYQERKTWNEAQATCVNDGGYLVVLNNKLETQVVKDMAVFPVLPEHNSDTNWDPVFVGLRDWKNNNIWSSVTGECLDWEWESEQPNLDAQIRHNNKLIKKQSCGVLMRKGTIDNHWCFIKTNFVCEKSPIIQIAGEGGPSIDCCGLPY